MTETRKEVKECIVGLTGGIVRLVGQVRLVRRISNLPGSSTIWIACTPPKGLPGMRAFSRSKLAHALVTEGAGGSVIVRRVRPVRPV